MRFRDISLTVIIFLFFITLYFVSVLLIGIEKIKNNWPEYKCNPMVMPLASMFDKNPVTNFVGCIASMQKNMMGYFLLPLKYSAYMTGKLGGILTNGLQELRQLQNYLRDTLGNLTFDIFSIFINLLVQFKKIIIGLKFLVMKLFGVAAVIAYLIQGQMQLGMSLWNGPVGEIMRALCFDPDTKLKLKTGEMVAMKDIELGSILENGSEVLAVLRIKANKDEKYYKIYSEKLKDYIYVTGSHKISNPDTNVFMDVCDYDKSELSDKTSDVYSCLVTSDHLIPIGEYIFWDWED